MSKLTFLVRSSRNTVRIFSSSKFAYQLKLNKSASHEKKEKVCPNLVILCFIGIVIGPSTEINPQNIAFVIKNNQSREKTVERIVIKER